jgi:hypothetical protein
MEEAVEENEPEFKIIRITNPNWLGVLAPQIKTFSDKLEIPSVTYETLYTYFLRTVQHGGEMAEFHVVFKNEEPIAFGHWFVNDLPHRGMVFCDWIHSWNRMREPVVLLLDKFIAFGKAKHAPIYKGTAINEAVFRVFRKAASKRGYKLEVTSLVDFVGGKI